MPSSPAISTRAHSRHRLIAGRDFDDVDDEGAADARRGLEEVPRAVARADELGVRHAAQQAERVQHARVQRRERDGVGIARRERPRDEDAGVVRHDERRRLVAARAREAHLEVEDDRVDVEDVAGDELLEQVVGAVVAKHLERAPQRSPLTAGGGCRAPRPATRGLSTHGAGTSDVQLVISRVVQRVHERRAGHARAARPPAHRQLVAKAPRRRFAHARHEQVLAQHRRQLDVEVVERDDAVDALGAGQVRGALADVVERHVAPEVVERVDRLARPIGVAELLFGQEQHAAPLPLALAQELVALAVGRDAEQGQGHGDSIVRGRGSGIGDRRDRGQAIRVRDRPDPRIRRPIPEPLTPDPRL